MISTEGLRFSYTGGNGAMHFPDFKCETGEQWLLIGQSGSGKTTLLHLLAGLLTPQTGIVKVNDTVLSGLPASKIDQFRGRNIGIVFQQSHFVRALTVLENLMLAQRLARLTADENKAEAILNKLNVGHKMHARPNKLSAGEQQRVAIARALINSPSVILADEPTSALDDINTDQVIALLKEQAAEVNATLLTVTHDNRLKEVFEKQIHLKEDLIIASK